MPAPRVAIVGRPNVGKSSLLNLIARERIAIVDPTPGVTRDRLSALVKLEAPFDEGPAKIVEVIDTGGYGVYVAEGKRYDEVGADLASLTGDIEAQIAEAVRTADLILFAVDVQAGITPQDQEIAKLLREQKLGPGRDKGVAREGGRAPVRVVATKVDGPSWEIHAYELAGLGFDEPLLVSSKTKYMRRDFLDALYELLPLWGPDEDDPDRTETDLRLAILGKRNSGKSTLINTLAGEPRVIVSEIAGTTRDAIDVIVTLPDGRTLTAIDTAGLRRKKSFQDQIEWYAFERAQRAITRCQAALLMVDATADVSQVDEQLAALLVKSFKPVAIVVNKWDLVEGRKTPQGQVVRPEDYEAYLRRELKGLDFAPVVFMSAKEGLSVPETIDLAFELKQQASTRVGTGELNRAMRAILERHHPASVGGKHGRVYFASQVRTDPPTIVLVVNRTDLFDATYERYLLNQIREALPFPEVPIRLILRSKRRMEEAAIKSGRLNKSQVGKRGGFEIDPETGQFVDELSDAARDELLLADLPDDPAEYFDD